MIQNDADLIQAKEYLESLNIHIKLTMYDSDFDKYFIKQKEGEVRRIEELILSYEKYGYRTYPNSPNVHFKGLPSHGLN